MRKILLFLCAFAALGVSAQETFTVDNTTYTVTGEGEVTLTKGDTKATTLVVPPKVANGGVTYTVTAIADEAYLYSDATSVTIPGTVKTIGDKAFYYSSIANLTLENGIETIGKYAFSGKALTSLEIPGSVKRIGDSAFFGSSTSPKLKTLKLNEGLEYIGASAFYGNAIESLEIPASVDTIASSAFLLSTKLKELKLNEGLRYLGDGAFVNGEYAYNKTFDLTHVTLPSTLTYIGIECFLRMPLQEINIPANVKFIGESAFAMTDISKYTVDPANENFHVVDGILYSKDNSVLYAVPMIDVEEVKVLDGCLGVNGGAFWGSSVKKVTLPEGIRALGYGAFLQSPLAEINLPNSISYIDEQCFAGTQLKSVVLPENLVYIYEATFAQCPNLTTVEIPSGVQGIDVRAFIYSNNLTKVTCKGSMPPYLVEASEYEEVFTSDFTLYVPKGCADNYKASKMGSGDEALDNYWPNYYSKIEEMATGVLVPVIADPVMGSILEQYQPALFKVQFEEPITLVNENPEIGLRVNYPYMASMTFSNGWKATVENGNTLSVFALDADGYTDYFLTEKDKVYYITIPAGVVKNAAGDMNEHLYLGYYGNGTVIDTAIEQVETDNAGADAKAVARYNVSGQKVNASQKGLQIVKLANGKAKKIIVK